MSSLGKLVGVGGVERAKTSTTPYIWGAGCRGFLGGLRGVFEESDWEVVCWVGSDLARCHNCIVLIRVDEGGYCWVYFDVTKEG